MSMREPRTWDELEKAAEGGLLDESKNSQLELKTDITNDKLARSVASLRSMEAFSSSASRIAAS